MKTMPKLILAALAAFALCLGAQASRTPDKVQLWEGGPFWSTTNIGADEPWDAGYYFWWGDTVGYKRENGAWVASDGSNSNYSFSSLNAPTCDKSVAALQSEGWITANGVLAPAHDAAQAHWGGSWRMPTDEEFAALINNCSTVWTTTNGVYGRLVTGKGDYANRSIFLPASGHSDGSDIRWPGAFGGFWSSTPDSDRSSCAWSIGFNSGNFGRGDSYRYNHRSGGLSVRPVLQTGFAGEGDGTEASPYVVTSKEELETVIAFGKSLFVKLAPGTVIEGPVAIPDDLSALSLDLNGGSVVGTDGQPAIMLLGDTAFTASGSSGTISADEGVESVKRIGSVSVAAGSGIEMTGMNSVTTSVIVPKFVDGGAAEATGLVPKEGGKWTVTAFGELANDALGRDVADGMVKVYASDTVAGLETADPLATGVEIKSRKSAVKVTLEVVPPTPSETQFFRVQFGE